MTTYQNHRYTFARNGRAQKCTRCGVRRRSSKTAYGARRRIYDDGGRPGRFQYAPPCGPTSWQYKKLPCLEKK